MTIQQQENIWRTLALIQLEKQHTAFGSTNSSQPKVEPMIKAMDGKTYIVKGYIIPLTGKKEQSHFMFSAYPYANCFFCGKAGPESVMEVFTKENTKIAYSEQAIQIKGTFHYLGYKMDDVMFSLENAVLISE